MSQLVNAEVNSGNRKAQEGGEGGGGYSGFQVTRMIEWGQKIKTQKISVGLPTNPQKSLDQTLTPKKSHAKFPSLKNFHKALNDIMFTKNKHIRRMNVCTYQLKLSFSHPVVILTTLETLPRTSSVSTITLCRMQCNASNI